LSREPVSPFPIDRVIELNSDQIESAHLINQEQLNEAKIFTNREEYIKTIPENSVYMELGVAWGYYSELIAETRNPYSIDLIDRYDQDFKCWSWRKFGECKCTPKHEYLYDQKTHMTYISKKFSKYKNVRVIQGDVKFILPRLKPIYDYIYIDVTNERDLIKETLNKASSLVKPGGIIGLNDYLIYDGIIEDQPYGTYQSVNEFLHLNPSWVVDGIALHKLGFYDIYLRRPLEN
jgi:hypothetical protein